MVEEIPLHEHILKIIYLEYPDKPQPMSSEDILWKIDDPDISLYNVKEVLDWLVRKKDIETKFGKYQLDRIKYLELKAEYKEVLKPNSQPNQAKQPVVNYYNVEKKKKKKAKKERIFVGPAIENSNPVEKINNTKWFNILLLFMFLSLAFLGWKGYDSYLAVEEKSNKLKESISLESKEVIIKKQHGIGNIKGIELDEDLRLKLNEKVNIINRQNKYLLEQNNNKNTLLKNGDIELYNHFNTKIELMQTNNKHTWLLLYGLIFSQFLIFIIYVLKVKK